MQKRDLREWETTSAILEDGDFWIDKSYFGTVEAYRSDFGNPLLLIWEGYSPDTGAEHRVVWPLGADWETKDGRWAEHPKEKRGFAKTSIVGRMIDRVIKEMGDELVNVLLKRSSTPRDARVWEGLGFHLTMEDLEFPARRGGVAILGERGGKTRHLMPTAFLGEKKAEAPKPEVPAGILDKLSELARSSPDLRAFQKQAIEVEGVKGNVELLSKVLGGELYEQLKK